MKVCRYLVYLFLCEIKYEGKIKNFLCGKFCVYRYVYIWKLLINWKNQKDMIVFFKCIKKEGMFCDFLDMYEILVFDDI